MNKSRQTNTLWVLISNLFFTLGVSFALELDYKLAYEARGGTHLNAPIDLATHRHQLQLDTQFKWKQIPPLSFVLGAKSFVEAAYASNRHYSGPVIQDESREIELRDCYLQFQSKGWLLRAGNQQVVWGEAHGFSYADIVNPRDQRVLNLYELSSQRSPTPLIHLKWLSKNYSIQGLYIPIPYFNRTPAQGSDLATSFSPLFSNLEVKISDPRYAPLNFKEGEFGLRFTALLSPWDLSIFYLNYLSREPLYLQSSTGRTQNSIPLQILHPRLQSMGLSASSDLGSMVLRSEALYNFEKPYNTVAQNSLTITRSDEIVGVLGIDYTRIVHWHLGMQFSYRHAIKPISSFLKNQNEPLLTVFIDGNLFANHSWQTILSYNFLDGSTAEQFRYLIPLSSNIELGTGIDWLRGSTTSQFGRQSRWTRFYVLLRLYS